MEKTFEHSLYAISPNIDYKDFYLRYHRRRNPIFIQKEYEFPKIKNISLKTGKIIQDSNNDINNLLQTTSLLNLIYNKTDNNKTNSINYSSYYPFIKTENICYPKINPIVTHVKNFISPNKTKIQKKNVKLSIKNLDIINLDNKSNLLAYEIIKKDKILENEIINTIYDPATKDKIIKEIKNIDSNTNQEIDDIIKKTSKEVQVNTFKNYEIQPKIINLCAEEIFEEFNIRNNRTISKVINIEEKSKNKNKLKNREKKEEQLSDIFFGVAKNNIRRKIELRNQYNQELSIEYIETLIRNELEKIKFILALYYYNSIENYNANFFTYKEDENSTLIKNDIKQKNYLNNSFNKLFKLNKYYDVLLNFEKRNRNKELYDKNKYIFNTIDKSKINNDTDYVNILMNHMTNSSDEEKNQISNDKNNENNLNEQGGDNNLTIKKTTKNKNLFHLYNKNKISAYSKLTKLKQKDLDKNLSLNRKNLIPIKTKFSINKRNEKLNKFGSKDNINLNEEKDIISGKKIVAKNKLNEISLEKKICEKSEVISINDNKILDITNENKSKKNISDKFSSKIKEESNLEKNGQKKEKEKLQINKEKEKNIAIEDKKKDDENSNIVIIAEQNQENKVNNEIISDSNEKNIRQINEGEELIEKNEETIKEVNKIEELNENKENENSEKDIKNEEKDISNDFPNKVIVHSSDDLNDEDVEIIDILKDENEDTNKQKEAKESISPKRRIKKRKTHKLKTKKLDKIKRPEKKLVTIINNPINYQDRHNLDYHKEIVESIINKKNILVQKKNKNNGRKNIRNLKLKTINGKKKRIASTHKDRKTLLSSIKASYSLIKNFEILKKNPRRILSDGNIHLDESTVESNQLNIIKLQDTDIDKILNFVNEEEKRRLKNDKSATKIEKEKIEKSKDIIHSLFKEKKEDNNADDNLTRDDLVEKLKKDDRKMRQYIEGIIRSGLTIGNKELNKQMKNNSILVYKDFNLGQFKFNRNFGIKDDFQFEPFRPLSGNEDKEENNEEKEEKEKGKKKKKTKKGNNLKEKKEEDEPKKGLIYDNTYLFSKKKSIKFILRTEVEEILNGGIILQQHKEEEKRR